MGKGGIGSCCKVLQQGQTGKYVLLGRGRKRGMAQDRRRSLACLPVAAVLMQDQVGPEVERASIQWVLKQRRWTAWRWGCRGEGVGGVRWGVRGKGTLTGSHQQLLMQKSTRSCTPNFS